MTTSMAARGHRAQYTPTEVVPALTADGTPAQPRERRIHTTRRLVNRYRLRELMAIDDVRAAEDMAADWPELDFLRSILREESALVSKYRGQLSRLEAGMRCW